MSSLSKLSIFKVEKPDNTKVLSFQSWSSKSKFGVNVYKSGRYLGSRYFKTAQTREKGIPKIAKQMEKHFGKRFYTEVA